MFPKAHPTLKKSFGTSTEAFICFRLPRRATTILFTIERRPVKKQLAFHFHGTPLVREI